MANTGGNTVPRIEKSEHIGPDDTGDNIHAKRVANYGFDGTNWQRVAAPFINVTADHIAFSNADGNGNYQTILYKDASNATILTLSLTYDGSSNVTSIAKS